MSWFPVEKMMLNEAEEGQRRNIIGQTFWLEVGSGELKFSGQPPGTFIDRFSLFPRAKSAAGEQRL